MFIPYATDAPVYHWPLATMGIMAANVGVFVGVASGAIDLDPTTGAPWALSYGQGLRPMEWLLSPFLHGDLGHLVGNLVGLWVFGLVVEGKLGPLRFLPVYLAIAVGESALEQAIMLGVSQGGSLGASSAIYGLLAIAAVWAPENDVRFAYWWGLYAGTVDIPLLTVAALYIGWDLTVAMFFGGLMGMGVTSGLLHVLGAAIGAPLGVLLLKRGVVDCEGWDLFTRYGGPKKVDRAAEAQQQATERAERALRDEKALEAGRGQLAAYLAAGNTSAAATLYGKLGGLAAGLRLNAKELQGVAAGLQQAERWGELAPVLAELIELAPQAADPLRVRLAQLCVTKLERPGRALELLQGARAEGLSEKGRVLARQVAGRAHAMQQEGVAELDDGGW